MSLPSQQHCYDLWDKYEMPENIREHSRQVTKVADAVARHLKAQGIPVNLELVNRGALLHDIAKIIGVKNPGQHHHAQLGFDLLSAQGIDQNLAHIVGNHLMEVFDWKLGLEEQIVNYADKRVKHQQIVSLGDRINDLKERYPKSVDLIEAKLPYFIEFEKKYGLAEMQF
ncbi:MAG TPA: hypothetical protein DDX47_01260 [Candidatus Jacksonbacteria bacterium]|nr:MAG: Metal dependent phosphohydrolase [Parcubacteria group bacterium GW2011_GWC2_44_22]HBH45981.1 hypothetical protein [Candidatus Jacksonbacteria bacterium]HCC49758.1 hypothetical protein [Candidatus Jacksonbacteria bacterium]HCE49225.1 hypothetical protein [Candidatus Jacksonbacteria bacterium]HCR15565.1 hypothetical protein [Candidatus Jacksonbacteria bacterium]